MYIVCSQNTRALNEADEANNVRTIEGILFKAMVNAGAVSKDNANDPVKVIYITKP